MAESRSPWLTLTVDLDQARANPFLSASAQDFVFHITFCVLTQLESSMKFYLLLILHCRFA